MKWALVGRMAIFSISLAFLAALALTARGGYGIDTSHGFVVVIAWHQFGWLN